MLSYTFPTQQSNHSTLLQHSSNTMALTIGTRTHAMRNKCSHAQPTRRVHTPHAAFMGRAVAASRPVTVLYPSSSGRMQPRARVSRAMVVEANLFSRIFRIVKAYVSNVTSSFEDPEVLLDRVTDEMQEDLIRMRQATAKVMASEKQMSAKYSQVTHMHVRMCICYY